MTESGAKTEHSFSAQTCQVWAIALVDESRALSPAHPLSPLLDGLMRGFGAIVE